MGLPDQTTPGPQFIITQSQASGTKAVLLVLTQNPQSLSHTRPVFLESQRVSFKVIWKQNTIMLKQVSSHLAIALNLQSSRQHSIKSNYQPGLKCFPWNAITKTGGTENSWNPYYLGPPLFHSIPGLRYTKMHHSQIPQMQYRQPQLQILRVQRVGSLWRQPFIRSIFMEFLRTKTAYHCRPTIRFILEWGHHCCPVCK